MANGPGERESVVFVVDDDASMRQALTSLLQSVPLRVEAFGSVADFLKERHPIDGVAQRQRGGGLSRDRHVAALWTMQWSFMPGRGTAAQKAALKY
jgi:hypothetical protein